MPTTYDMQDVSSLVHHAFPDTILVEPSRMSGTDEPTGHYYLKRSIEGDVVGKPVGKNYTPQQTDQVARVVEASCYALDPHGMVGDVQCRWRDGHHVIIKPTDDQRREISKDDTVFPVVHVSGSLDGRAFRYQLGMYRDVCMNLAMMQRVGGLTLTRSINHTSGLNWKMEELVSDITALTDKTDDVIDTFRTANEREVTIADFLREVYPMPEDPTERTRNTFDKRVESIVQRLWRERDQVNRDRPWNTRATAWEMFNAVQGYEQHDARRRNLPRGRSLDRAFAAFNTPAVERASALAFA